MTYISRTKQTIDIYAAAYEQLEAALEVDGTGLEDELLNRASRLEALAFELADKEARAASIEEDRACLAYRERFMCDD